jgi:Ca2+-transporting ATPase
MTTIHRTPDGERALVVCKGAPEVLLDNTVTPYGDIARAGVVAADLARQGYRVLAVADRTIPAGADPDRSEAGLRLAGLVAITDPVRHNAADVLASLGAAGVHVLLITGDARVPRRRLRTG